MKKSLIKVISALLLFTFIIALTQSSINTYSNQNSNSSSTWEVKNLENIKNEKEELYEIPYTTMNVGIINGGSAKNSVSAKCKITLDFRSNIVL